MSNPFWLAACLAACLSLAGCDQRPRLQVVATADAPSPPTVPAFAELPSRGEVLDYLEQRYQFWEPSAVEFLGSPSGEVRWIESEGRGGSWVHEPNARVIGEATTRLFGTIERAGYRPAHWVFGDGKWQPDQRSSVRMAWRPLADPSNEQLTALLQMPGIKWAFHRFARVPRDVVITAPARFPRDADGFALPNAVFEFTGITETIDDGASALNTTQVTLRGRVRCEVIEGRWWLDSEVELLSSRVLSSTPARRDELSELHWRMDHWWRDH